MEYSTIASQGLAEGTISPMPKIVVNRGISIPSSITTTVTTHPTNVTAIQTTQWLKTVLRQAKEPNSKLVVLEFTAPWSEPCKFMRPMLEVIASRFKEHVDFYEVDVEQFKTFARNTGVLALPTFFLVRDKLLDRVVGVSNELEMCIEKHILPKTTDLAMHPPWY